MLREIKHEAATYFINEHGHWHGEFKEWWVSTLMKIPRTHCFYVNDKRHGEYKYWDSNGILLHHCFFVNDIYTPFSEILYPNTAEDRLYFTLKYNLPLLPIETE